MNTPDGVKGALARGEVTLEMDAQEAFSCSARATRHLSLAAARALVVCTHRRGGVRHAMGVGNAGGG
jgi:hypothetical protein